MRAAVTAGLLAGVLVFAGAAPAFAAGNPSGTGLPSQSCQDLEAAGGTVRTLDGAELRYGKPGWENPHFVCTGGLPGKD